MVLYECYGFKGYTYDNKIEKHFAKSKVDIAKAQI